MVSDQLGKGYTVEEQLTGQAKFGGMQIEVIPSLCTDLTVRLLHLPGQAQAAGSPLNMRHSAKTASVHVPVGSVLEISSAKVGSIEYLSPWQQLFWIIFFV